ncbi:DUF6286 domain-containing protein [Amycolatopsis sp. cmx-4-61]|uniref:DUF6286 domain-containing protein n=1 Tax=Amycolatopsis sp. cmx-4-61 TaxID=2790937 RepID=UPI00397DFF3A
MKRRPRRSVPALLTALVLLAACVLVCVSAVQLILGERPWISYETVAATLHNLRWTDVQPALAGGFLAVAGLVLLLAAVMPGAATVLPVDGPFHSGVARGSYRSALRAAVAGVDGVSGARVKLRSRRVKVRVTTTRTRPDGLADAVRAAVTDRLDRIGPATRPAVAVRVRAPRRTA